MNICNNNHVYLIGFLRGSNKGWNVFYHFIGAAPGSTDIGFMLQRMLKELKYVVSYLVIIKSYELYVIILPLLIDFNSPSPY